VGVGKTHLLHAIGNKYVSMVANKSVVFFNSDDIINNIYNTKKENDTDGIALQKLKTNFLQYDLMLVDDIQFFGKGKEGITEIFFNIFNKMVSTNKKIIVASDRNLEHLHGIDQRIISRLASGVTCIIEKPNVVAIKEIIKRKLATGTETFRLTDDALHFLASHTNGDIRKLDGTINTIIFHAINNYENNSILTTGDLQKILNTNAVEGNAHFNSSINPMFVIESICNDFNINVEAVISITRVAAFVRVRSICMYILKHKYKLTLNAIGSLFSNRSHTTVIEAIEKIEKQVKKNDEFANLVFRLMNKV
jgi:chromosomal replication initiator protein